METNNSRKQLFAQLGILAIKSCQMFLQHGSTSQCWMADCPTDGRSSIVTGQIGDQLVMKLLENRAVCQALRVLAIFPEQGGKIAPLIATGC